MKILYWQKKNSKKFKRFNCFLHNFLFYFIFVSKNLFLKIFQHFLNNIIFVEIVEEVLWYWMFNAYYAMESRSLSAHTLPSKHFFIKKWHFFFGPHVGNFSCCQFRQREILSFFYNLFLGETNMNFIFFVTLRFNQYSNLRFCLLFRFLHFELSDFLGF